MSNDNNSLLDDLFAMGDEVADILSPSNTPALQRPSRTVTDPERAVAILTMFEDVALLASASSLPGVTVHIENGVWSLKAKETYLAVATDLGTCVESAHSKIQR